MLKELQTKLFIITYPKANHPNGTSSTDWSNFATTDPILSHEFNLTDFNIEITQSEDDRKRGNIFASWTHTHGCVKRYAIEVLENQDQIKGQVAVENAPAITNKVHNQESRSEIQKFWGARIKKFLKESQIKSYMG